MLALVRDPDGKGSTVHRTYLEGAAKAKMDSPRKLMPGTIAKGSAIRIAALGHIIGIAEGLETALAVTKRFGISCWSALNATMLREFAWPPEITELHIFGDNDQSFTGQAAAYQLAFRASTARDRVPGVFVHIPDRENTDWLDHLDGALSDAAE